MGMPAGAIVLVSFRGSCFGQRIILTHTYRAQTAFPAGQSVATDLGHVIDGLIAGGAASIESAYRNLLPDQYTLQTIRAQMVWPTRSSYTDRVRDLNGLNELNATVANDAAAVTLRTALAGRDQVATKHIGPIPDTVSADGLLLAGYLALLNTFGQKLVTGFPTPVSGVTMDSIIYHRVSAAWNLVTAFTVGRQSRVMRRRTVGVGE